MNYAIYFGLAFAGCFMAIMMFAMILVCIEEYFLNEGEEGWKNK